MTPKQTKDFIELCNHAAIKDKFDRWRIGDTGYLNSHQKIAVFHKRYLLEQGLFVAHVEDVEFLYDQLENCIWLPSVFSYTNPERCLWAWVGTPIDVFIYSDSEHEVTFLYKEQPYQVRGASLPIALATAVIWQYEKQQKHQEQQGETR